MLKHLSLLVVCVLLCFFSSSSNGDVQTIALHPTDPDILYLGSDRGLSRTSLRGSGRSSQALATYSPRSIVVSQSNHDLLYTGTFEMGVFRSNDGAETWEAVNDGLYDLRIRSLVIHPHDDRIVFAGTEGTGVFKTLDSGQSWREINHGLIDKVVRTLVIDPGNPNVLYAGTWHGVYKTNDGGENWHADPEGLYDVDVRALALDPTNPRILYAGTQPRGMFRSPDGGETWIPGANPLTEKIEALAIDPANPSHIYVGTRAGVFVSKDQGDTFESAGLRWSNRTWCLVFDPKTNPPTLYYGGISFAGAFKTTNGGKWWEMIKQPRSR
jgi:photosystem II stability/assembly factor-like uncharacterized protein